MDCIIALLQLLHTKGLGRSSLKKLIDHYGGAHQVLEAGAPSKERMLFGKYQMEDWEEDFETALNHGVRCVSYQDPEYPKILLNLPDFPLLLYVKGEGLKSWEGGLAIVGTREATIYGREAAYAIAKEIATYIPIISGLARGIDTAAHEGALAARGQTIAVLGSGIGNLYPRENSKLAEQIVERGALVSEYPMKMAASKTSFPQRNRIISGLSQGVCLVESPIAGGGMLTMQYAAQQKKLLWALPGRVDWPSFQGNHLLIKQGKAHLVEHSRDILSHLKITCRESPEQPQLTLLTKEESGLLEIMSAEEKSIEELVLLTQLPIMQLNVLLMRLILKKVVKEYPGKIFKKIAGSWEKH